VKGRDSVDKIRWGVLGAGGIADRRTLPGMMKAENAQLVAVMEVAAAEAERLRVKYSAKRAYTREEALLSDPEVDAVYIASPVAFHARQIRLAADRGKHILVEKPLALSADEGQEVVQYCHKQGARIAAGLMMRFGGYVMAMKQAVARGSIGSLVSCGAQFTCWYPDIPGSWRQSRKSAGGGALMDMGVHCIDLIQYISGSRVRQVSAFNDTLTFGYEVEDSSMVLLRLDNGAMGMVQTNFNIPDEAAKWRLEFFGTNGRLLGDSVIGQVDGGSVDALFVGRTGGYDARQDVKRVEPVPLEAALGDMYAREIESFGHSILMGTPLEVPAEDAIQVQRVVEAAYRSSRDKRVIEF